MAELKKKVASFSGTVDKVQLIDLGGKNVGIVQLSDAQARANAAGVTLVQVGKLETGTAPPVLRMVNLTNFEKELKDKEELKAKAKEEFKRGEAGKLKELRFGNRIAENDAKTKTTQMIKFLEKNYRVKVTITFKSWREFDAPLATELLNNIKDRVAHLCKASEAKAAGRFVYAVFEPDTRGSIGQRIAVPHVEGPEDKAAREANRLASAPKLNAAGDLMSKEEVAALEKELEEAQRKEDEEHGDEDGEEDRGAEKSQAEPQRQQQRQGYQGGRGRGGFRGGRGGGGGQGRGGYSRGGGSGGHRPNQGSNRR
jgi:translation initiation factor IF-3